MNTAVCESPLPLALATKGVNRCEHVLDAGVDLVVVDTAHGHSAHVIETVKPHQTV